jgi:hypothetical protein
MVRRWSKHKPNDVEAAAPGRGCWPSVEQACASWMARPQDNQCPDIWLERLAAFDARASADLLKQRRHFG